MWTDLLRFFIPERKLVAAIDDLTSAVAANTALVQQVVVLLSTPGVPQAALEPLTAALVASNAAMTAVLTPPPAP